jgi:hypothetical protein
LPAPRWIACRPGFFRLRVLSRLFRSLVLEKLAAAQGRRLTVRERYGVMTPDTQEFIRRFLMHVLPQGLRLLALPFIPIDAIKAATTNPEQLKAPEHPCPRCAAACASSRASCSNRRLHRLRISWSHPPTRADFPSKVGT